MEKHKPDRYIFVAFFSTTTRMGQFIRTMTHHTYNHASLSLYPDLRVFFSFARHHENTPFYGGFIKESFKRFPRNEQTVMKLCRLRLTAEQYQRLCNFLKPFLQHRDAYTYNLISAVSTMWKKRTRLPDCYTCVEFVRDALVSCGYMPDLPEFCDVAALEEALADKVIYEGSVLHFPEPESWEGDTYPEKKSKAQAVQLTAKTVHTLLSKAAKKAVGK